MSDWKTKEASKTEKDPGRRYQITNKVYDLRNRTGLPGLQHWGASEGGLSQLPSGSEPLFEGAICAFCMSPLHELIYVCTACKTPHHKECWDHNGGCTTFGCPRSPVSRA